MFIAALFTIARSWKQPKCPSTDEWIKKMWYIYTMEYYSAIKRNKIGSVGSTSENLGLWLVSEVGMERHSRRTEHLTCEIWRYLWACQTWAIGHPAEAVGNCLLWGKKSYTFADQKWRVLCEKQREHTGGKLCFSKILIHKFRRNKNLGNNKQLMVTIRNIYSALSATYYDKHFSRVK